MLIEIFFPCCTIPKDSYPSSHPPKTLRGHVYCDGGMCNDFPVDALPEDSKRMGLMVRPVDWIRHHVPGPNWEFPKTGDPNIGP